MPLSDSIIFNLQFSFLNSESLEEGPANMDFIKDGIEKLDTKDKIPQSIKDKIPGEDKKAKGQGEHLTKNRKDVGGFPNGIKPER